MPLLSARAEGGGEGDAVGRRCEGHRGEGGGEVDGHPVDFGDTQGIFGHSVRHIKVDLKSAY